MAYNLNQAAMITGLTARTLRNHLKQGLLRWEKIDGNWRFTEEALDEYIADPSVKQVILTRQRAVVYDFLSDPFKKTNRVRMLLDFPVSTDEALGIAQFFSKEIMDRGSDIGFRYINERHYARFILSGAEEQAAGLMKACCGR